ncbi:MAG: DeoR/GlpR transcriptional regulator [Alphaproteobacteria bacterium]|nr:DeoR/GlpR transcriptional regulator [Alphaproteobacteria bacterium]
MISNRQDMIRNYLFEKGQTPVQTLADVLGASLATVRRDLAEMEQAGSIERLHGSARIASGAQDEVAFDARESANLLAKRAIASEAAKNIIAGSTIFLDAGTTVLQLAKRIKLLGMPLTVFTNGVVVAQELAYIPEISVNLLGGRIRPENMSIVGPLAERMIDDLWFDQLFLGASAIADDGWLSSYDADEARLNACMTKRAQSVYILADGDKFSSRATYNVFCLSNAMKLITDVAPNQAFGSFAQKADLDIIYAE